MWTRPKRSQPQRPDGDNNNSSKAGLPSPESDSPQADNHSQRDQSRAWLLTSLTTSLQGPGLSSKLAVLAAHSRGRHDCANDMPSTVTNAVYVYSIRLGSSLRSLVSQKRVPWPDALRVLDFIAASLHSHAATLGPTAKPLPLLPRPSANPLGRAAFGQAHDSHHSNTREQITRLHD